GQHHPNQRQRAGAAGRLVRRRRKISMTSTLLRGRTLSFLRWPEAIDDHAAWRYEEDGGLLISDGRIVAAGAYAQVEKQAGDGVKKIDHRPHLLLPGFIDAHVHFPQMQVIASYGAELLDWLGAGE